MIQIIIKQKLIILPEHPSGRGDIDDSVANEWNIDIGFDTVGPVIHPDPGTPIPTLTPSGWCSPCIDADINAAAAGELKYAKRAAAALESADEKQWAAWAAAAAWWGDNKVAGWARLWWAIGGVLAELAEWK